MATLLCAIAAMAAGSRAASALEASSFNRGRSFPASASVSQTSGAVPTRVVPLGTTFGIRLFTDGVIVASLSGVDAGDRICCPAEEAGIRPGDYVLRADGVPVQSNADLARLIGGAQGKPVTLTIRRDDQLLEIPVTPVSSGGSFKAGIWIRDSAAGIGTLTFWDPVTGRYAGLGHGICDIDTGDVMSLEHGEPAPITLCGVVRGTPMTPGRLRGYFAEGAALGTLDRNDETGVYGMLAQTPAGSAVEVLPRDEVRCGPVKILVSVDESDPKAYDAEILRISTEGQRTRNLVVKITDPVLLEITGGIVQGMSGCPILQEGKLAGAVTHVLTGDPSTGYGIFAQTMCEECARVSDPLEKAG